MSLKYKMVSNVFDCTYRCQSCLCTNLSPCGTPRAIQFCAALFGEGRDINNCFEAPPTKSKIEKFGNAMAGPASKVVV